MKDAPTPRRQAAAEGALAPLREPVFRMLWLTWLASHVCMWMNDVAAAWLMTSLTTSPVLVALVQTAATLPVFLLGLPSGALADIVDRRRYFLLTQVWVAAVAIASGALVFLDLMAAHWLLLLTFANGIGLAMRWPVFSAIVPELVPRTQLPAALGLNAIAMNTSRIVGPLLAGSIIAGAGIGYVYALNAVLSLAAALAILRWKRQPKVSVLPAERFVGAVRAGLRYVRESTRLRPILLRTSVYFVHSVAAIALLPLLARDFDGESATIYTVLIASLGCGAIVAVFLMPRLRRRWNSDTMVRAGSVCQSLAVLALALSPNLAVAVPVMIVNGLAWITVANSLSVSAQLALPDWVRARAMSVFQVVMMGSNAVGALIWGKLADLTDIHTALAVSAISAMLLLVATSRVHVAPPADEEEASAPVTPPFAPDLVDPGAGPVLTMIEYRVDAVHVDTFLALMEDTRRSRLQQGSLSWELFRRVDDPQCFTETIVDETWADHLRRFERMTAADLRLRERRRALQVDGTAPRVVRSIGQRLRH
ncbi:MAG: MFS transporter [Lautropia sp.]